MDLIELFQIATDTAQITVYSNVTNFLVRSGNVARSGVCYPYCKTNLKRKHSHWSYHNQQLGGAPGFVKPRLYRLYKVTSSYTKLTVLLLLGLQGLVVLSLQGVR